MGLGCSHVSWRLKRGLWLTMTLASPTETSKSWKEMELGGWRRVEVLGRQWPGLGQPGWLRGAFVWKARLRQSSHLAALQAVCASSSPGCG